MADCVTRYIKRTELDTAKWDRCIDNAPNGLIYAYSWYLDHMAENWDALIWGDYQAVMPLPWKKKWGIRYLYWVPFAQQLGVFANDRPARLLVHPAIKEVHKHFRYGDLYLNYANEGLSAAQRMTNLVLDLNQPYDTIAGVYKSDLQKNLQKAAKETPAYERNIALSTAAGYFQQSYQEQIGTITAGQYQQFEQLCRLVQQNGELLLRGAMDREGQWLATALLLKKGQRMYLLQSTTLPKGRKISANHWLLDQVIREFAGTGMILDFEGSDLPGVAHFYRNFGAREQPFYTYHFNRLPWYIRWIKK